MRQLSPRRILWPLGCLLAFAALAADHNVTPATSSIIATFRQQDVPVDAPFGQFSGTIDYDPARSSVTSAALSVDMASLDLGDAETNAEARKPAWFDTARYPRATFRSTSITPGAAGHFDATGTLALKGRTQLVTVAVTVQRADHALAFDGSFDLSRKSFGVGDSSWEGVLDDTVRVRFHLLTAGD